MGRALPQLRVQLLGEFRCWRDGELIAPKLWKTAKIRELFAILISERGRLFTQYQLIDRLWPGSDSEGALTSLRRRISELRKILEPDLKKGHLSQYVLRHAHGYCFSARANCWVDIEEFSQAEREGREREHVGDWLRAVEAYNVAAQLYRGDFLTGESDDWTSNTRDHWRERYLYVLTRLAECYSRLGSYPEAIDACRRAIQADPHYEEGHRRLMLYYYLWGERTQALKIYEDYRRRLAEELGLSPSSPMEELRRQIIQGAVSVAPRPPPSNDPVPYSLAQLPFVGREAERAQLQRYLQGARAGQGRLVLLSGEPGVGKTRLAQEILKEVHKEGALVLWGRCRAGAFDSPYLPLAEALRDGLLYVKYEDLAPIKPVWLAEVAALTPEMRTLLPQIPQNPVLDPQQAQWRLFEAVAQFFIGLAQSPRFEKPLVLWLDDLQWAAPALLDLLDHLCHRTAKAPICVIGAYRSTEITEKHPLHKKLITGCKQSHQIALSRLSYAAVEQMLTKLGPKLPPEFCHFLYRESQGNPLLATTLLRELFDRKILTVAADGGWICTKTDQLKSCTALGIRALLRQRLARLSSTEQRVLQLAAVVGRDCDYELLKAAWGQDQRALDRALKRVSNAGLLAVIGPGLRYDFTHDRLREIVSDEIGAERPLLHRRIAHALERLYVPKLPSSYGQLAHHYDRAGEWESALRYSTNALEQAVARYHYDEGLGMAEIGLRAARKLAQPETVFTLLLKRTAIHHRLGKRVEQKRDIEALFKLKKKLGKKLSAPLEIEAYRARAVFCRAVGCYGEGVEAAQQMLALLHKTNDRSQEAKAFLLLGSCYWVWGQYAQALQHAQRARAFSQAINEQEILGDALHLLGQIHAHTGMYHDAVRYYRSTLQVRRKIGDKSGIAYSLNNIGNHYRAVGDYQKALDAYSQSLALYEEIGHEQGRGRVLSDMADLYCRLGSYEKSLQYVREALEIQESVRDLDNKAQTLIVKGHALEGLGQLKKALTCYQRAQVLFERVRDVRGACHALNSIGSVQMKLSQDTSALRSYAAALSRLEAIGARDVQIESLVGMGLAHLNHKKKAQALKRTQQAVDLLQRGFGHVAPQEAYFVHYQALRAHGRRAEAKRYLGKAYEELMRRAQSIRDRELRESFLTRIEMNQSIPEDWRNTRL